MLMKNPKTQVFTILFICLCLVSCKAQQIIMPLNSSALSSPTNSYFKDLNNELDPYVGIWQANFQNKMINLLISKEINVTFEMWGKAFSKDILMVRFEISSNGLIQQSTLNKDFATNKQLLLKSMDTENNGDTVNLVFYGGNCSIGLGNITFQKIDNTHFNWSYFPKTVGMNDIDCPPNQDYNIYLPITQNLIFTKQ